jgi:hypothetical protein
MDEEKENDIKFIESREDATKAFESPLVVSADS